MSGEKKEDKYDWGDFLRNYREPIGRVIEAFAKRYSEEPSHYFRTTTLALGIVLSVIAAVVYLGASRVLTDNTIAFVLGTVVGYVFSFIRDFLPSR